MNLIHTHYDRKIELISSSPCEKMSQPQKCAMYILHFMATFHNFALKIETSSAKRVVQPILETRNVSDVS